MIYDHTLKFFLAAADEMSILKNFRQCQSINKLCLLFMECLNAYLICLVYLRSQVPGKWQFWHGLSCRSRYTCSIFLRHVQFILILLLHNFFTATFLLISYIQLWSWVCRRADMTSSQSGMVMVIFYVHSAIPSLLAVQDSSITDIVCLSLSVGLSQLTIRA